MMMPKTRQDYANVAFHRLPKPRENEVYQNIWRDRNEVRENDKYLHSFVRGKHVAEPRFVRILPEAYTQVACLFRLDFR